MLGKHNFIIYDHVEDKP